MLRTVKKSPTLKNNRKGSAWRVELMADGNDLFIVKFWAVAGGKEQSSTPEGTDARDAAAAFDRAVTVKRDKGYSEAGDAAHVPTQPMLAHKYAGDVSFPVWVQPKLDGFRMLMDGENAWTRGGKDHVAKCVEHLMWDTDGYTVDGELLLPGNVPLQQTASAAKKYGPASPTLMYYVYDVVADLPYRERLALLQRIAKGAPANVRVVLTEKAENALEVADFHAKATALGFEGTIVRLDGHGYEVGARSHNLLKLKDFQDDEFRVVGVEEGTGSFAGKAIIRCATEGGAEFTVVPEGTHEYKEQLWRDRASLRGKWLTVRYQTLSAKGKPIFPVGVAFRDGKGA